LLDQSVRLQYVLKIVLGRSGIKYFLLLYRKPNYVIGMEEEGIVTVFQEYSVCKPSMRGQVYSIGVHTFFVMQYSYQHL